MARGRISPVGVPESITRKGRRLKIAAGAAPVTLGGVPFGIGSLLTLLFGATPALAATFFFLGVILGAVGLAVGLILSAFFAYRHTEWAKQMRDLIAADGIKAEEIEWFKKEIKPAERRALAQLSSGDPLLLDAYRETLATRLTATRIIASTRREQQLMKRRLNKITSLANERSAEFKAELERDLTKISELNSDAQAILLEAESRMQMIEASLARGTSIADSELALKKLNSRSEQLPLALEEARLKADIRVELERELSGKGE